MDFGYPRPQLERAQWISLNGTWRFRYDDECALTTPDGHRAVAVARSSVPYPPESAASGIGDSGFHKVCWYQRDFELTPGADRVILRFGAVDYSARVWVNGWLAAVHEGGHTPFWADITHMLDPSGQQKVTRAGRGRSARPDQAARQAGLAARAALDLVSAHHRHLADRLAGAGGAHLRRQDPLDAAGRGLFASASRPGSPATPPTTCRWR